MTVRNPLHIVKIKGIGQKNKMNAMLKNTSKNTRERVYKHANSWIDGIIPIPFSEEVTPIVLTTYHFYTALPFKL